MHKITTYNLGNADTTRIDLANGRKILIDYANMRCAGDSMDKRNDLPTSLRADLKSVKRNSYDVVAFTHLDNDHTCGASEFFHLDHAPKYQGGDRIIIDELWVPAAVILEEGCEDETRILRQEARHRLIQGKGIRVFSRPVLLEQWLKKQGISLQARQHLITDAGNVAEGFTLEKDGVEFFIHSPFASRTEDGTLLDRNSDALTMQATFDVQGKKTRMHFFSDIDWEVIAEIVRITEYHGKKDAARLERLKWNICKIAHHCSYKSLASEKGKDETVPDDLVKKLFEIYGEASGRLISTSKPIPNNDDDVHPPHRQAANYYKKQARRLGGKFMVTMEEPSEQRPAPIEIKIDQFGASFPAAAAVGGGASSAPAPRAGIFFQRDNRN